MSDVGSAVTGGSEGSDEEGEEFVLPADGMSYDPSELPVSTQEAMDWSVFDDMPLDDEGVPMLPDDFDRSQLPGQPG